MYDEFKRQLPDADAAETQDWIDSLDTLVQERGVERARFVLHKLLKRARQLHVGLPSLTETRYINTISPEQEPRFPGDEKIEHRIRRIVRWNAALMVMRANQRYKGIGGHLSSYASSASLYEVGFNHFFRGKDAGDSGDQVFYQGHAAPGIYSRAYLEGRLTEEQLDHFRREVVPGEGLSSYPHPRLMPEFWEFPTVSMGLGPINAIYQARFNRYLLHRGLADTSHSRVWAFLGDGECDEPEALGALSMAAREGLDNLTFVINCNLQRLDGPVRGNGKVIQELESIFRGAGWNVIKVIWGREWDELLARDIDGVLVEKMMNTVDGEYQKYAVEPGSYVRERFFGPDPRLQAMVAHMSDEQLKKLRRGGHDHSKLYAAYSAATRHKGAPTVILAKTVKGWTLGPGIEARNITHQAKMMTLDELKRFRDTLQLPIADAKLADAPYYNPGPQSEEVEYLLERRRALGGCVPKRVVRNAPVSLPSPKIYEQYKEGTTAGREVSTTMVFATMLRDLIRDKKAGKRIVPIVPDEARTFGMDPLFKEAKVYTSLGQRYEPVDSKLLLSYLEATDGQMFEEGITEAGAMASFTAAGTSYSTHGETMIPFYTFYSMFGFQRIGDLAWAFGDARGRGFLMGGTAGRTTLNGEGLQHEDGHSHVLASTFPNCLAYDPAYAFELALIVKDGVRRMFAEGHDVFYYITLYNETYAMPQMPDSVEDGVVRGMYKYRSAPDGDGPVVRLFGSGPILPMAVLPAADVLSMQYGVRAEVWSVTSYQQLRNDALACERWSRLNPELDARVPYVRQVLGDTAVPTIAATDYMKSVPDMIARWVPGDFVPMGTDGFGRSDTREALRRHFEIDVASVVCAALASLARGGAVPASTVTDALAAFEIDPTRGDPREA